MYHLLSLLTGVLISLMVAANGELATLWGMYSATVIVHVVGLLTIAALVLPRRERPFVKRHPLYLYLGGVIGVATTLSNNLAYGRISVSAIMALGLLGQSVAGLAMDQYGFLGMPKHPFQRRKVLGLALILAGIAAMTRDFDLWPVAVSFAAGGLIVISRTLNARLAALSSVRVGTFHNYWIGLATILPLRLLLSGGEAAFAGPALSAQPHAYLGGVLGVAVVLLCNMTVAKVPALYLSVLQFVGQVFSSVLLDALIAGAFSGRILMGGALVAAGLCVNLLLDRKGQEKLANGAPPG